MPILRFVVTLFIFMSLVLIFWLCYLFIFNIVTKVAMPYPDLLAIFSIDSDSSTGSISVKEKKFLFYPKSLGHILTLNVSKTIKERTMHLIYSESLPSQVFYRMFKDVQGEHR